MLNKTDVSNQLTGLRPKVKQAAVHLAHHLTREIKKCESRKGPKAEKFHKKAESHRKEVLLLKKIKPDVVSRYSLMMDFNAREKLLGDINIPLETKVIIKLATHKSVLSHVQDFRKAHPDWESKVPDLLENLGIRAKFKKKLQKEQEKQKRKLARKQALSEGSVQEEGIQDTTTPKVSKKKSIRGNESEGSGSENESDGNEVGSEAASEEEDDNVSGDDGNLSNSNENISDDGDDQNTTEDDDDDDDQNTTGDDDDDDENISDEDENTLHDDDDDENTSDEDDDNGNIKTVEENQLKLKTVIKGKEIAVKPSRNEKKVHIPKPVSAYAEVRRFADLMQEEPSKRRNVQEASQVAHQNEAIDDELSENEPVEEDPFFMTEENRFLKTVAVKRKDGEGLDSSNRKKGNLNPDLKSQWTVDGKNLKGNRAERRAKFLGKDLKKKKSKDNRSMDRSKEFNKSANSDQKFFHNTDKESNGKSLKNHKFADKKSGVENSKSRKDILNEDDKVSAKRKQQAEEPAAGESLHPSWEAKRRQKVSLDNFQGKKITFGDD